MGKVTTPFYLPIARTDDGPDVAGIPGEYGGFRDALADQIGERLPEPEDGVDVYHVYKIGSGQRKSPEFFEPEAVKRESGIDYE